MFLIQHELKDWANVALRRGYLAVVFCASDHCDDTETFLAAYPGYDWSVLMRRAWAASRCVDYLDQVPEADVNKIAIAGHSRYGKQSLLSTAFDERIAVAILSSTGSAGVNSARYLGDQNSGQSIEISTRSNPQWYHTGWRFFVGRENKLPADFNQLVALCAPRPCLLTGAINDLNMST